ncbi:MAG: tetratricopeptide repeat protein, partial [Planctomycetota bacterium]
ELEAAGARPVEKGILALWSGRHDEALKEFARVSVDEAGGWEAELYSATAYYLKGEFEEAKTRLAKHRGRDPEVTVPMWIRTLIALAQARERAGKDSEDLYEQAIGEADALGGSQGRVLEARALVSWGKMLASFGKDPEKKYSDAIERVEGLKEAEAHLVRGDAWMARAEFRDTRGRLDPQKPVEYEEAVRAYGEAAEGPGLLRRAEAHMAWFRHLLAHGRQVRDVLNPALQDYRAALAHNPKYADAAIGLAEAVRESMRWECPEEHHQGTVEHAHKVDGYLMDHIEELGKVIAEHETYAPAYLERAKLLRGHGGMKQCLAAIADLDRAVEINPNFTAAYNERGLCRQDLGMRRWSRRKDPRKDFEEAIADFERALDVNPLDARAYVNRAHVRQNLAGYLDGIGEDPIPKAEEAIEDFGKAIGIKPDGHLAFRMRGLGYQNMAVYLLHRGDDPAPAFRNAIEDYGRALELKPRDTETLNFRGLTQYNLGDFREDRGEDLAAVADFDLSIKRDTTNGETHRYRGLLHQRLAACPEEDPDERLRAAIEDYGRAVEFNPRDAAAHSFCSEAWELLARRVEARGEDASHCYTQAVEECTRALKIRPDFVFTRFRRAEYLLQLGRNKEALADLERVVELRPSLKERAEPLIRRARGKQEW